MSRARETATDSLTVYTRHPELPDHGGAVVDDGRAGARNHGVVTGARAAAMVEEGFAVAIQFAPHGTDYVLLTAALP